MLVGTVRLFVATDFGVVLKTHFGELKMDFAKRCISLSMVHTRLFHLLEGSKCVVHFKYEKLSSTSNLFQKISPPKFRPNYSSLVGPRKVWGLKY
jgi:hypothetical protein